jgi:hypothetical protein
VVGAALVVMVVAATVAMVAGHAGDAGVPTSGSRAAGTMPPYAPPASSGTSGPLACDATGSPPAAATAWSRLTTIVLGRPEPGGTLARTDPAAGRGPQAVVVRRRDGSLGRHGAVVTFPVAPAPGHPVAHGRLHGTAADRQVVWPLAGSHARVRGDVGVGALLAIAARTSVVQGRPVVRPLRGYVVTAALRYRPKEVREVRYRDRGGLGAYGTRLGFVYTGVVRAAGFEDQLYLHGAEPAGAVHGWPALASTLMGGNGAVAWSPVPGVVAYVAFDAAGKTALLCLARRTRPLSEAGWRATGPAVVPQRNDIG